MSVAVGRSLQDLVSELFHGLWRQGATDLPHVLLEVIFAVFKDEIQVVLLINYFLELNDIRMLDALEQRDLADGCARHAVVLLLQLDLFECHDFVGLHVLGLVDHTIGTLTELVQLLVLVEIAFCALHFCESI